MSATAAAVTSAVTAATAPAQPIVSISILEDHIKHIFSIDYAGDVAVDACTRRIMPMGGITSLEPNMANTLDSSLRHLVESAYHHREATSTAAIVYIISFYPNGFTIVDAEGAHRILVGNNFCSIINFLIDTIIFADNNCENGN